MKLFDVFVVDRRPRGFQAGTRRLRVDSDDLFVVAHRCHISCVVMRLPQGSSSPQFVVVVVVVVEMSII